MVLHGFFLSWKTFDRAMALSIAQLHAFQEDQLTQTESW
jgi:hypothetical protein